MKRTQKFLAFVLPIAGFVLFCSSVKAECPGEISSTDPIPSTWTKECSPYVIKTTLRAYDPVTIEPGVVVKFKYGASATFYNSVTAIGTEKDRIVFTAWTDDEHGGDTDGDLGKTKPKVGYWHRVMVGSAVQFENASFLYGGEHPYGVLALQSGAAKTVSVKNSEFKHNKYAGIYINYNPDQTIENNVFSGNNDGIVLNDCYHNISATISGNSFENNANYGAKVNFPNYNKIDARNNWWGDKSGPYPIGRGDKISSGVLFDPWIGKDGLDPVIIIPGILGSWEKGGLWQIDPIFHTYDNLMKAIVKAGYPNDGKIFSVFPYQWRDSNVENAKLLHNRIQQIKKETGLPRVDIVAHSMGGLLAREYIESNYYENDVDQLITVGTPHLGAPKTYIKWEAGAFLSDIFEQAGKLFFEQEAKENGYTDAFSYIRGRPMSSVRELLPVYNYLYDVENDYALRESYPDNYPRNEFLENLNDPSKAQLLEDTEFTKIIGKINYFRSTTSGFDVVDADMGKFWQHGYPHGFEIPILGDQGLRKEDGDRTVPIFSAEATQIPADKTIYLESEHNILPTDAQKDILEILTGKKPDSEVREWAIDDILMGLVFSPVDFQIVSPSGQRLGKNFETGGEFNEIEGAFYTGSDAKAEFLTIPNPEKGEYKILAQGTGSGEYKIETTRITEVQNDPQSAQVSTAAVEGVAQKGGIDEAKIEVTKKEVVLKPLAIKPDENQKDNPKVNGNSASQNSGEAGIVLGVSHSASIIAPSAENTAPESIEPLTMLERIGKLDELKVLAREYFAARLIKKKGERNSLLWKLGNARVLFKRHHAFGMKMKINLKKQATLEKKINQHLNRLISRIRKNSPKKIDPTAAAELIEKMNAIKI